ncbi:hypothetical protein C8Q77DRAFT_249793 [Trametes polyzona]|nr:hypothetical protein C8Q77DRAFT_249793 [Trametes polyzona]
MKAFFVALALAASALAQGIFIIAPAEGSTIQQGAETTITLQKQNSLTNSEDVSVAIGLESCGAAGCGALFNQTIGTVLFKGDFAPKPDSAGNVTQDFTVQVPADIATGPARLSVAHFYILGASNSAVLDVTHSTLNIGA